MSRIQKIANRVFERSLNRMSPKVAGEIRFVKDQGPDERDIPDDFDFRPKHLKGMAKTLFSMSCAMGHLVSASNTFTKLKSVNISPDGKLGGKGYIQKIPELRKGMSESIEVLSNAIDTLHDEIKAPHWVDSKSNMTKKDKDLVDEMLQESEEIVEDPEGYDESVYQKEVVSDV